MDKMTVVLDRKNITMSLDGKSLRIDCPGSPIQRVPLGMVGQVIVYGSPVVGCNVWRKLSEEGIPSVLLPARGSGVPSWISPGLSTSIMVRIDQFKAWADVDIKTRAAAWLLRGKFNGLLKLAEVLNISKGFLLTSLEKLDAVNSIESMMGIEGSAAREWFGKLAGMLPGRWKFKNRNRRPPKDPVNALLSLGYTLLVSEIQKQVHLRGLDPCLGFLHSPYSGRESMVLDLAEPLRPGIDAFVMGLIKDEALCPEDFTTGKKEGCRMSKQGRGIFYPAFEEWKNCWLHPVYMQAETNSPMKLQYIIKKLIDDFVNSWNINEIDEKNTG